MTRLICILLVLAPIGVGWTGCGAIEEKPRSSVDSRIESMIREAGGTPSDWALGNDCHIAGSCAATLAPAAAPDSVVAYNRYIVKDSRATLKGADQIEDAVERAADRKCFSRYERPEALLDCIAGGAR